MCGFAGYSITDHDMDNGSVIKSMADTIAHRGPDDEGFYTDDRIALGFRRLSIIDLAGGRQPIFNEDGSVVLVFNGEIYNFKELRSELISLGHKFVTDSDSEVIVHGYEQYGEKLPEKLIGMFAFVIWDKVRERIFGARDIFGIKPFYYYKREGEFMFASEIKAFLPNPRFQKELNEELLPTYLCFEYIPTNETFFRDVYKLPGGCCFTYENGELSITKYYEIRYDIDDSKSLSEWAKLIDETLSDSVRRHRISDVEVGCFLSSGVDSSIVAKKVSEKFEKINGTETPVKTFSIGYENSPVSELEDSSAFAKAVGLPNIPIVMEDGMFFDNASHIQYMMDEPLPNPSEIPLYYLAKKASEYVKVVLSGEGADELFAGYPIYLAEAEVKKFSKVPKPVRSALSGIAKLLPDFKGKHFLISASQKPYERYLRNNYVFTKDNRNDILKKTYHCEDPKLLTKPVFDKVSDLDPISQTQYADIHVWMAFDILQKADKMSMANSLELRVPFLDRHVLELAMKIPPEFRTDGKLSKICLRESAKGYLPERTVEMKKKGFPVPLDRLLREKKYYEMVREKFTGETAEKFFRKDRILKLLEDHKQGSHNMKKIWTVYSFILWYEEFFVKR